MEKNLLIFTFIIIITLLIFTLVSCSRHLNLQLNNTYNNNAEDKNNNITLKESTTTSQTNTEKSLKTESADNSNGNLLNKENQNINIQPILLQPVEIDTTKPYKLLKNHPTEFFNPNVSFEKIYYLKDYFSDKNGFRPFPWGKEIFAGKPEFLCDSSLSRTGKMSFKIIGKNILDDGALAVPNINLKPKVIPGRYYYLSFWINYNIYDGNGVRLIQQFFKKDDIKFKKVGTRIYPSYACYGPWITGTSNGQWVQYTLIAKAPDDAFLGDPVIALLGIGSVNIDDVYFGEIKF